VNTTSSLMREDFCREDDFQTRLLGKALLRLFQGLSAALLMPLDVLQSIRRGSRVAWQIWCSWLLSALICIAGSEMWMLANQPGGSGRGPAGEMLLCLLGLAGAAMLSGGLQAHGSPAADPEFGARGGRYGRPCHRHFSLHRYSHQGDSSLGSWSAQPEPSGVSRPPQSVQPAGVCCGDCRRCAEAVCVKTGRPKRKEQR
jgi:hypothetical protein